MLCLVRYLFVILTSVIDCLGRFVPKMTYYVLNGTLNLSQLNSTTVLNTIQHHCSIRVILLPSTYVMTCLLTCAYVLTKIIIRYNVKISATICIVYWC